MHWSSCAIKRAAEELGLAVYQPARVRDGSLTRWLRDHSLDLAVVFAYGRILPADALDAPRLGCVNLHASLLPKYRGAAPIQRAIAAGETETGISLMKMDPGLDTGPVYSQRHLTIPPEANAGQLSELLSELAVTVIRDDLPQIFAGQVPSPQDDSQASHAPPIQTHDLVIDFTRPAVVIERQVRAFAPTPAAFCYVAHKRLKVLTARAIEDSQTGPVPGEVIVAQKNVLLVQANPGLLSIEVAQLEGKRAMAATDLVNGRLIVKGQGLQSAPVASP